MYFVESIPEERKTNSRTTQLKTEGLTLPQED
jgi:hypothetical protein